MSINDLTTGDKLFMGTAEHTFIKQVSSTKIQVVCHTLNGCVTENSSIHIMDVTEYSLSFQAKIKADYASAAFNAH